MAYGKLGQSFVVENLTGDHSNLTAREVLAAPVAWISSLPGILRLSQVCSAFRRSSRSTHRCRSQAPQLLEHAKNNPRRLRACCGAGRDRPIWPACDFRRLIAVEAAKYRDVIPDREHHGTMRKQLSPRLLQMLHYCGT
jgi:hypothetical protein